jgi:hypothetical protein
MEDWTHAWFDSVQNVASKGVTRPRRWYHKIGFGISLPRPEKSSPRETLANEWASNRSSLLSINSGVHDMLILGLLLTGAIVFCLGVFDNGTLRNTPNPTPPALTVIGPDDLDKRTASIENAISVLSKRVEVSQQAIEAISNTLDEVRINTKKTELPQPTGN